MQSTIFTRLSWSHIKEQCVFPVMEFTGVIKPTGGPFHQLHYLFWGCIEIWSSNVERIVEPTYRLTVGEQPGLLRSAWIHLAPFWSRTHGSGYMPMCLGRSQRQRRARHQSYFVPTTWGHMFNGCWAQPQPFRTKVFDKTVPSCHNFSKISNAADYTDDH